MNIKRALKTLGTLKTLKTLKTLLITSMMILILVPGAVRGESTRIIIDRPGEIVFTEQVLVEGSVVIPSDKFICVRVEPFIEKKDYKAQDYIVAITGKRFKKAITVPSGISIITASTLDNRWSVSRPVLLFSTKKGLEEREWGKSSPIRFTEPAELNARQSPCNVKGRVADRSLKNIEVVILNLSEFQRLYSDRKEMPLLDYKKAGVKSGEFSMPVELSDGLNLIIARPEGSNVPEFTQTKVLVYESASPRISLAASVQDNNMLVAEGNVKGPAAVRIVSVRVEALVRESEDLPPSLKAVFEQEIPVDKKGNYRSVLDLKGIKGIFANSYFLVSVSAGKEKTVRLVVK